MLVVEDSEDDALLLLRGLERGGYQIEHQRVETSEAMEKALVGSGWDVILSDYGMPRFGALQALAIARQAGSKAPFIVVSGRVEDETAIEAVKAGAHDYVMKDDLARLYATVERGLEEAGERRRAERELRRRDAILGAVRFAADRFLSETDGWEESIQAVLGRLGAATEASRVYIFENHEGEDGEVWGSQRHEWVAPGISAQMDNPLMEAIPYRAAGYGRWVQMLGRGEPVYGDTREFPKSERPELREQGILSIVIVPIFVEERWWGQIGFDECVVEREWSAAEVAALGAAAGTLGAAIKRSQIEERLRGSEERYRALIEQATDGIYLLDAGSGRLLETNPSFQRMLGFTADELDGMEVYDFVAHPREDVDSTIRRTLVEKRRVVGGRRYRRKDGSLVDVEVGVSVISYGGREVICTIVRDVTERKEAEGRIRTSEAGLADAQRIAHLGNWEWDLVSDEAHWSDELYRIHGFTPQDPILSWEEFLGYVHPSDRDYVEKSLHGALHESKPYDIEHRIFRPDGSERVVHCQLEVTFDEDGGAVRAVGTVHDVTERKHNEEALRQSERLYRTVLVQASENICLVDVETVHVVEANPAFRETLGYSDEELRRLTLYDIVAHDRASVRANMQSTLEAGSRFVGQRKYRRKDGSLLDVEVSASTILRDGRQTFCVVAHDVSERARAQRLLEERVATLARVASSLTLDAPAAETLRTLAQIAVDASTATACVVMLADEETGEIRLVGSSGLPEGYTEALQSVLRSGAPSPTLDAIRERRPMLFRQGHSNVLAEPLYAPLHRFAGRVAEDTTYVVPLIFRGRVTGAINFAYLPNREPKEDEKAFLGAVADQTAVAVENARLLAEARGKAALEERQRLARELHDSVSQALYGIVLGAKTAYGSVPQDPEGAVEPLEYVLSLAEAGLAEMRSLIFELRPESLEREGLVVALEKQAVAIEARHGIAVKTVLGDDEPRISPQAKEEIYRIVQEALHNTAKHARAGTARVDLRADAGLLTLEISDDGIGFDTTEDFPGHLGLRSMRERASNLGGTLEVDSAPGQGTTVRVLIPVRGA